MWVENDLMHMIAWVLGHAPITYQCATCGFHCTFHGTPRHYIWVCTNVYCWRYGRISQAVTHTKRIRSTREWKSWKGPE